MFSTKDLQPQPNLRREELVEKVSQEAIMEKLGLVIEEELLGERFCSPFRPDSHPDCKLYYNKAGKLIFYDPAHGLSLDCIDLVQYALNKSYVQALQWVHDTFIEGQELGLVEKKIVNIPAPKASKILVKSRAFTANDYAWWNRGVSNSELQLGRVLAISAYWLNDTYHPCYQRAYAYQEEDGYKLYFPEAEKGWRFLGNTKELSCYELLPQTGDLLVITSSKKDALCLRSFGYWAVAPQGEGMDLPAYQLWELKQRFQKVVLFYDNDAPGLLNAHEKCQKWQVDDYVFLPFGEEKDPFAYCCQHGADAAKHMFNNLLR